MAIVYLSLGSNKGDKLGYIQQATRMLGDSGHLCVVRASMFYETEPWGNKNQEWFVNAVIEAQVDLSSDALLELCQSVETKLGRNRDIEEHWGARTVDIDILFYDNKILNSERLCIPHKHLHERAFVLVPLMELIPDFVHPVFKKTIIQLHEALANPEDVYLYGTRLV